MRAFIAIETPEEISKTLEEIQKKFKDAGKINFTKPPYHLTLKFLGDISEEQAEKIMSLLRNIKIRPFELELSELGVFPNESYIRVLWVGVKDSSKVNELQQQIDSKLAGLFEKDLRFHAHITLGRVKFIKDKEIIKELLKTKIPALKFEVKEFKLIKSELTPKGPEYEDVEVFG
ncbi:MAG: RNA 2',3'-cyclic phosphodiesterase [Nanoarchaeota archaeon]|nr:RNA 2',3'-cyclic phosphodiesterase [Nanoarchaeota archaeon]